ncbi:MAG: hydantoinase/oxoprolinase family protein [Chloroflexota bacterium]
MTPKAQERYRVGVDIGGTFTDIVFLSKDGKILTHKLSSTPDNYTRAVVDGIQKLVEGNRLTGANIAEVVHGCTVATNAVLEHSGARAGLITTRGFRDILEIRRFRIPEMYNLHWNKPPPLVPRELRLEVDERISARGEIIQPLSLKSVREAIDCLVDKGVVSVAVCLINSYANRVHEQKIKEIIRKRYPHLYVTISSELVPVINEYERTSEAVVNAYVMEVVTQYLSQLNQGLEDMGVKAPLLVMTSSGGMMSAKAACEKPVNIIECGPAAGVVGSNYLGKKIGVANILAIDMGGTTTKASLIEKNQLSRAPSYEVGAGISMASRLSTGGGYIIRVPAIDIAEIGAGGGSKLWIDAGGAFHVGPRSAGAYPGPVCYNIGGTEPTVTDANLVLGYLNPEYLVGGALRLKSQKSYQAIEEKIARPLKMDVTSAAYGAFTIANSSMIRAIRAVSTERGRDPRDFTIMAYGGAGPIHAATIARELGIKRVIVPPNPGLFSAFGLLFAEIEHHKTETILRRLDESVVEAANEGWKRLEADARAEIEAGGYGDVKVVIERYIDARYIGQAYELIIPVPWSPLKKEQVRELVSRFHAEHLATYAHQRADEAVDVVNLRLVARIPPVSEVHPDFISPRKASKEFTAPPTSPGRKAYFGRELGWREASVLRMTDVTEKINHGPAIIELYDATVVIPPGCEFSRGAWETIEIRT